ncbi:hypothetical protein CC78DRAFT_583363 [Lojkania enalia]|uniref:Uncharacterized protein n=1 Tax=Lojkania enalia TaxID=147567 RepID=A0A9P4K2F9_9PLEO|nr:hypothetical protein CC78DRAFT_583363 [Didymosphaeria enalia]
MPKEALRPGADRCCWQTADVTVPMHREQQQKQPTCQARCDGTEDQAIPPQPWDSDGCAWRGEVAVVQGCWAACQVSLRSRAATGGTVTVTAWRRGAGGAGAGGAGAGGAHHHRTAAQCHSTPQHADKRALHRLHLVLGLLVLELPESGWRRVRPAGLRCGRGQGVVGHGALRWRPLPAGPAARAADIVIVITLAARYIQARIQRVPPPLPTPIAEASAEPLSCHGCASSLGAEMGGCANASSRRPVPSLSQGRETTAMGAPPLGLHQPF